MNRTEIIPGISDHDVVFAEIDLNPKRNKQGKRKIPLYNKGNWDKIQEEMKSTYTIIRGMSATSDVDALWCTFKTSLQDAIRQYVPHKTCSAQNRPPWINGKVKKLITTRNHLYRKSKKAHNTRDQEQYKSKLRSLKHSIRRETRTAYWNYVESIIIPPDDRPQDSNKLWTFIKHRKSDTVGIAPLKDGGVLKDNPADKAEILNRQFKSVFTVERPEAEESRPDAADRTYPNLPDLHITTPGIQKLLERLNPNKAMGPDELHPRVLKQLAETVAPILHIIFTKSMDSGEVPVDWKTANVAPIFKK